MGTNNIPSASDGTVIPASNHNSLKEAFEQDIVPRNTSGVATAVAGSVGSATYPFLSFFFGIVASGLSIAENAGKIVLKTSGVIRATIGSSGIEAGSYAADSVRTIDIQDANITKPKLSASNHQVSSGCGVFTTTTTSTTGTAVTNLSVTITTEGRPVLLMIQPYGSVESLIYNAASTQSIRLKFLRDSTEIGRPSFASGESEVSGLTLLDTPSSGTYTYTVKAFVPGGGTGHVEYVKLAAVEL